MDLIAVWRRRLLSAMGAGIAAPVAILAAALAVGVGGGGVRGLGALGQVLTGPELPTTEVASARADEKSADDAGELLASAIPPVESETRSGAGSGATQRRARRRPRRGGNRGTRRPPARTRPPSATPAPGGGGSPTPAPQPTPTPTPTSLTRQTAEQVKETVRPVPIVGEPAGEVIDLIVETAESLPVPPPRNVPVPPPKSLPVPPPRL